jgi:hypothetical protein
MTTLDPTADQPAAAGPQAGWYHDPAVADGSRLRWWNGAGWSEHTRPLAAPPVAAPPAPVAAPIPGLAPALAPQRAATTAAARRTVFNGSAWLSFALGLVSLSIVALVLVGHRGSIWISTSGVIAIISGIRALRLRSVGVADALVPAVLGIAFGGLGTLLTFGMLVLG